MKKLIFLLFASLVLVACGDLDINTNTNENIIDEERIEEISDVEIEEENEDEEEIIELSAREEMILDVLDLVDESLAFDTGSYVKGDIPKGEYAFITFDGSGEYYSEEDASGSIIDNENFDSFGYVQVHEAGNLQTRGVLVNVEAFERLGVSGAKELFEIMNDLTNYNESGWYKIGVDLDPGEYIIESYGSGYVAVMSGPVGNSNIVDNENFEGRYSVNVKEGQYLVISRGYISE